MEYPYNLTEDQMVLDPGSVRMLEVGNVSITELLCELVQDFDPVEIDRIFWSLGCLCRSDACKQWLETIPGRKMEDWVLMALETAVIWERG